MDYLLWKLGVVLFALALYGIACKIVLWMEDRGK